MKDIFAAKVALRTQLQSKTWFNGIGIGEKDGVRRIHVYTTDKSREVLIQIPFRIEGHPVAVFFVRQPRALRSV